MSRGFDNVAFFVERRPEVLKSRAPVWRELSQTPADLSLRCQPWEAMILTERSANATGYPEEDDDETSY